jgi:hypothetical protein
VLFRFCVTTLAKGAGFGFQVLVLSQRFDIRFSGLLIYKMGMFQGADGVRLNGREAEITLTLIVTRQVS